VDNHTKRTPFSSNHNGIPDIDPQHHQLLIHGLVDKSLKFDIDSLLRYPMLSRINFLECAGNTDTNTVSFTALDLSCQELFDQLSGAEWSSIPMKYLLQETGLKPTTKWVIVEGADGGSHSRSIPITKLLDDTIIALYQNGERLRPSQGYPMRLFCRDGKATPVLSGCIDLKSLTGLCIPRMSLGCIAIFWSMTKSNAFPSLWILSQ